MSLEGNWLFLWPRVDFEFSASLLPSFLAICLAPGCWQLAADMANYKINVSSCMCICMCASMLGIDAWNRCPMSLSCSLILGTRPPRARGSQPAKTRRILHKTRDKALQQQTKLANRQSTERQEPARGVSKQAWGAGQETQR